MEDFKINWRPIFDKINSLESSMRNNMQTIYDEVNQIESNLNSGLSQIKQQVDGVTAQLINMMKTQKFQAAYQAALTEIIRVRQELEQKFGTQKLVRDSMLGILQAADLSLITESTISKCTEELMISAPKYWLAPCLITLAAWISNNESLAKRAIEEAYKRDKEKTCLLFALITRRVNAGRIQNGKPSSNVSFEWLGEYFKEQKAEAMSLNIIAFIDAYTNQVFGEDKDKICKDHIDHWMKELQEKNPNFIEEQKDYWKNVFNSYCNSSSLNNYSALKCVCDPTQFSNIANYIERIDASERELGIKSYVESIMNHPIDTEKLIKDIDEQLNRLVNEYEEDEVELRNQEERLSLIKDLKGDEEHADRIINAKRNRINELNKPVDFAQRLSNAILDENASPSAKKTALSLLEPYISEAFNEFITANKDAYPEEIDLYIKNPGKDFNSEIPGVGLISGKKSVSWSGKTINSSNRQDLVSTLKAEFEKVKKDRIDAVSDEKANKKKKTGIILCCTVVLAIFGLPTLLKGNKMLAENAKVRNEIKNYYDKASEDAVVLLNRALDQKIKINNIVSNFLSDELNQQITI